MTLTIWITEDGRVLWPHQSKITINHILNFGFKKFLKLCDHKPNYWSGIKIDYYLWSDDFWHFSDMFYTISVFAGLICDQC